MQNQSSIFSARNLLLILLVATLYFFSARMGLMLAFQNSNSTPIWPPSGIAFAALLLLGKRIWPGITLGAFAINVFVFLSNKACDLQTALWVSSLISFGNTLEALVGYYLLKKLVSSNYVFQKATNVLLFAMVALLMCIVSATVGPFVVCLSDIVAWNNYPLVSFTWWTGDVTSVLVITPIILVWAKSFDFKWNWSKSIEMILLFFSIIFFSEIVFNEWFSSGAVLARAYLMLPFLLWAALRFELREVVTAVAIILGIAVFGTIHGHGPFIMESLNVSLVSLQGFISVISFSFLILSVAIDEKK